MPTKLEEKMQKMHERGAENYFKKYRPQMEAFQSKSALSKTRSITPADICALGEQLDQYSAYEQFVNEAGSLNSLGKLPAVALDVITVSYGMSILPVIASVQPIDEQYGFIYYKNTRAENTKGNITEGDILKSPKDGYKTQDGYAHSGIDSEVIAAGDGTTTSFTGVLAVKPLTRETLNVTVSGSPEVFCMDKGTGNAQVGELIGKGVYGTVNYKTGAFTLEFAVAPANAVDIYASYNENYEESADLPMISTFLAHKPVYAKPYALKGVVGLFQSFSMQKRWGNNLESELATDLVAELNKEIGGDLIRKIKSEAVGTTTFDKTVPNAVSIKQHYEGYQFSLNNAESTMNGNLGRGRIGALVVGRDHAAILQGLDGFKTLSESDSIGPHVFGTYKGRTVVRVPEDALLGANEGLAIHKGKGTFDAACFYSPYMPIVSTEMMPEGVNPLRSMRAAAAIAAVDVAVPALTTKINIIST